MIKVKDVKKIYSKDVTLGPYNIEIKKSGITSLIGPNGAGKSTLLLMIGRLLDMDEGKIEVANYDVYDTDSKDIAKILSILKQENHFISRLTVRQLISFGRFPYSKGHLTNEDQEIIDKYIKFLDLKPLENRFLDELSGGQKQRAYIAMVLCQETEYILLDEPLNNLDISRSVSMMRHLREVCDELNKTIILVMHDINFAARYSDNICALKDGKIYSYDKTENIMKSEVLSEIFETEIEIMNTDKGPVAIY